MIPKYLSHRRALPAEDARLASVERLSEAEPAVHVRLGLVRLVLLGHRLDLAPAHQAELLALGPLETMAPPGQLRAPALTLNTPRLYDAASNDLQIGLSVL